MPQVIWIPDSSQRRLKLHKLYAAVWNDVIKFRSSSCSESMPVQHTLQTSSSHIGICADPMLKCDAAGNLQLPH